MASTIRYSNKRTYC